MTSQASQLDPILMEVFKNGFEAIADEMALILMRTAHSPIVRDAMDFSTALCDADGENLAQGLTTPMHLGSFHDAMRHLIAEYAGNIAPGDIFIANDPYLASGQHLPDIYVVKPIFAAQNDGQRLVGWAASLAHHVDIGGLVPGSNSIGATEIHQEGLRLPFLKLEDGGTRNAMLMRIIASNVRVPEQVTGDIEAQIAATRAGEIGLQGMVARYGADTITAYGIALQDYSERLARAAILEIPDGTYRFTDHIDGLGDDPEPITLTVAITVAGDEVTADWTGTVAQVKGGINAPLSFCKSNVYAALRSVMSGDVPNCHGYTRPITVIAPEGCLVNAVYPAPCGARGITGYRIVDCMFGALALAVPEKVAADGAGGSTLPSFGGRVDGKNFVFSECIMGTWGATSGHDGQDGVPHMASNQANVPVEMIEADYPIHIERYGFVADTGGAGRYRGGLGLARDYRLLTDDVYFGVRSDKADFPPHGLAGGGSGAPAINSIVSGDRERSIPTLPTEPITLGQGDVFRHMMAGGGGYGDPLERDPQRVLADLLDERITVDHAREAYGVIVTAALELDTAATATRRTAMKGTAA